MTEEPIEETPVETADAHEAQLMEDLAAAGFSEVLADEPEPAPEETPPPEEKEDTPEEPPAVPEDGAGAASPPEEAKPEAEAPPEAPAPAEGQKRLEQAANAFLGLSKIVNGTAPETVTMTPEQGKRFIESSFSPLEVSMIRQHAQAGGFGEESADVLALTDELMPTVLANAPLVAHRRQQQEASERVYREGEAALEKLYPEWNKPGSEHHKAVTALYGELLQVIPNLNVLPTAPQLLVQFSQLKRNAGRVVELEAQLKAEKDRAAALEKRFGGGLPNRGTSGSHGGKKGTAAEEQLKADLAAIGFE